MKKAVYTGTFDPPTLGHEWVIDQSRKIFEKVIVVIAINSEKKTMFTIYERKAMLLSITKNMENVSIEICSDKFIANFAKELGAEYVVRGVRGNQDLEYETLIQEVNRKINPNLQHVYLVPPTGLAHISSSLVKSIVGPEGWENVVSEYVSISVLRRLKIKFGKPSDLWKVLVGRNAKGDEKDFWEVLKSPYYEQGRFYHNIDHINSMLTEKEEIKSLLIDPEAVELAIWIHERVYDTHASDNELRSADEGFEIMKKFGLSEFFCKYVHHFVLVTDHKTVPLNTDEKYIADIDLAILGKDTEEFDEYEKNIRKEYSWVPEETYRIERKKVLQYFLKREYIYYTEYFRDKYETKARENLKRSIEVLSK